MGTSFDIRQAQPADEAAVRSCAEDAYEQYIAAIGKKPAPMVADFAHLIVAGHVHIAVNPETDVLGFVIFWPEDEHVQLENVAVRSDMTGCGIGRCLIDFCEREAKRRGATSVRLYTNEKMIENLSIYPHLGYLETGRRTESGFNRVFFEKAI